MVVVTNVEVLSVAASLAPSPTVVAGLRVGAGSGASGPPHAETSNSTIRTVEACRMCSVSQKPVATTEAEGDRVYGPRNTPGYGPE